MSQIPTPPAIYTGKINLWVEDPLVRDYLIECWSSDPDFRFLIAGGCDTVWAAVKDAERHGHGNVYGFSDRDFRPTNRQNWNNPNSGFRVFVPEVHEVENYLLDSSALFGCEANTGQRTEQDIAERLWSRADKLVWWMACRSVIAAIREDVVGEFLKHPTCLSVTDKASAESAIVSEAWYRNLGSQAGKWLTPGDVSKSLQVAHLDMQKALANPTWRKKFSGKELFREVRDWLYAKRPRSSSGAARDSDVARMIASWQVANNAVPDEIVELRLALRARVGI